MAPTIHREQGFRFFFFSREEPLNHVHVIRAEGDSIVAINSEFCSDSGVGVQNGEGMTQVIFESCATVH